MKRLVAMAVTLAALGMAPGLWAQRGPSHGPSGGRSFGGGRSAPMGAGFSSFRPSPGPTFRSSPSFQRFTSLRRGPGIGRRGPAGGRFPGRRRYGNRFFAGYGYPFNYTYGYGPFGSYIPSPFSYFGFPSDYQSDQAAETQAGPEGYGAPYGPGYGPDDPGYSQGYPGPGYSQSYPGPGYGGAGSDGAEASAAASAPPEPLLPTVLVYRDGHQMEVQNYAIYGQTVWVFGDQITRKIAFADLDLAGTKKVNDQRGVEFDVPE